LRERRVNFSRTRRREPLPPLVSPDDDREFQESRHTPALEAKTAR